MAKCRKRRSCDWTARQDRALLRAGLAPHTERWRGDGQLAKVAKRLGKTELAARSRLRRLMRAAGHVPGNQWTIEGLWTAEEDDAIRAHLAVFPVPDGTWPAVAAELGRTTGAVRVRACNLRKREASASRVAAP